MRRRKEEIAAGNLKAVQAHQSARECAVLFIEFTMRRESSIALAKQHHLGEKVRTRLGMRWLCCDAPYDAATASDRCHGSRVT
jgi:hypothetical protein